jgi:two-component system OmpR family sensor kinase
LKYGGPGAVEVSVGLQPDPAPGDGSGPLLWAVIRDHGPGIASDQRERVFERFARLQAGGGDGTGLGLSVARGLAVGTGGSLEVVEVPDGGSGAAFALGLPAERIEEA